MLCYVRIITVNCYITFLEKFPFNFRFPFNIISCCEILPLLQVRVNSEQEHFLIVPHGLLFSEVTASSLVSFQFVSRLVHFSRDERLLRFLTEAIKSIISLPGFVGEGELRGRDPGSGEH